LLVEKLLALRSSHGRRLRNTLGFGRWIPGKRCRHHRDADEGEPIGVLRIVFIHQHIDCNGRHQTGAHDGHTRVVNMDLPFPPF
jgi:hypothetical protein